MTSPEKEPNDITTIAVRLFWTALVMLTVILGILHHFNFHNFGNWHWLWVLTPLLFPLAIGVLFLIYVLFSIFIDIIRGR